MVVLTAGLAACNVVPIGQRHQVGIVQIGADLPLTGDDAVDGLPVRDAIMLAISRSGTVCGASSHADACIAVEPRILDDVNKGIHDPAKGVSNLQQLAGDPGVVGVIGPLYDSVARSEIPVANAAALPLISPANTDVCLTQEPPDGHCQGLAAKLRSHRRNTYFRTVATELSQGPAAADVAYGALGKRRAFAVNDSSPLGKSLMTGFMTRFQADGGKLAPDQASADVVYFPGSDLPAVAAMRREMVTASVKVPLIGSDTLATDQFARAAGLAARGSYYTVLGAYPPSTRTAGQFIKDYRMRFRRDPGATELAAFDAVGGLLAAISLAIDDSAGKAPSRATVLSELSRATHYAGAMGSFAFDAHGDTTLKWVSVFQWLASSDRTGQFTAEVAAP